MSAFILMCSDYSDVLTEWTLMPYATQSDDPSAPAGNSMPLAIAVTAHHFLTLTPDK
jgi:hypothetical protein